MQAWIDAGEWDAVRQYLDEGGDPNWVAPDREIPLLYWLMSSGQQDLIILAIERGAKLSTPAVMSFSPLHVMCGEGFPEVVSKMLDVLESDGAISRSEVMNCLDLEAYSGEVAGVKDILARPWLQPRAEELTVPCSSAIYAGSTESFKLLLSSSPDPDETLAGQDDGFWAIVAGSACNVTVLRLLHQRGVQLQQPSKRDPVGRTGLDLAVDMLLRIRRVAQGESELEPEQKLPSEEACRATIQYLVSIGGDPCRSGNGASPHQRLRAAGLSGLLGEFGSVRSCR